MFGKPSGSCPHIRLTCACRLKYHWPMESSSLDYRSNFIASKWKSGSDNLVDLHRKHINPQMPEVLRIIGFDKKYVKAEGVKLWDDQGNEYLDFLGGYSVFNLGHNAPAIRDTLRDVLSTSWPNLLQMDLAPLSAQLALELSKKDPSGRLQYAYFGNSGSEAVEAALKFAKSATKRGRLLGWDGGFHGTTMGPLSLCSAESWKEGFGPFVPGCKTIPFGDLEALERELSSKDVAAFISESIQGEGGVRELSKPQWTEIQRLCRKYGTLLILDEIQTGIGRTGKFFAFEHWGVEADIVCLSKALTNGFVPASATLCTERVIRGVFSRLDRCVVHSSTFGENNLAMAAALAVLHQIDEQKISERAARMGELALAKIRTALKDFDLVKDIRGRGLMIAVEFGEPKSLKLKMAWGLVQKTNAGLFGQMITSQLLMKHRILTQVAGNSLNVLKLSPPLIVSEEELDRFVAALADVVLECHRFPGGLWDFGLGLAKRAVLPPSVNL